MKRILPLFSIILTVVFSSCEPETMLTVDQTSLSYTDAGGSSSITLTANKPWSASSNQSWCKVSPSSGDGSDNSNFNLSVSCDANITYDERSCVITIVCEELTSTITVTQAEGKGLILSQTEYNISNEAQTISVDVQANVQYTVTIDDACKSWIKQESTKGLSPSTIKFAISKNESYDGREGKITIRQTNGSLSATVVVKQSQTNGLFAEKTEYEVSYEEQQLDIVVNSNVNFSIQIDNSCKDWVSQIQTKGLKESTVRFIIAENQGGEREGLLILMGDAINQYVRIKQDGGNVFFADAHFKEYMLENYDENMDGEISYDDAQKVTSIDCSSRAISSLSGISSITNLSRLICLGNYLTEIDLSNNNKLEVLNCSSNPLICLNVDSNSSLKRLYCESDNLSYLDVSKNTELEVLYCSDNYLSSLELDNNLNLLELGCSGNNISTLSLPENDKLTKLICERNQIKCLTISGCLSLQYLSCNSNNLTILDVCNNRKLSYLNCDGNQLSRLELSNNPEVSKISCRNNRLEYICLKNTLALTWLDCSKNQLKDLDIGDNTALVHLNCSYNNIDHIDLSNLVEINRLYIDNNNLTDIELKNNKSLVHLNCDYNILSSLDVSHNSSLIQLSCNYNLLTILDVSNNLLLKVLNCRNNPYLSEIWLRKGQELGLFNYDRNVATIYYKD